MKKLITLLLSAGLLFSVANNASAVEVKASGDMDFAFESFGNLRLAGRGAGTNFQDYSDFATGEGTHGKHFAAAQRFRLNLDFIASENLSAHYSAWMGAFTWGGPATGLTSGAAGNVSENTGGALGTRASNIVTWKAYVDWLIPNTNSKVRMGLQSVAMPSYATRSPVLDDTVTGIMISSPVTENIGLTSGWLRAASDARRGSSILGTTNATDDTLDLFTLNARFKYDGFGFTPWVLVGPMGKNVAAAKARPGVSPSPDNGLGLMSDKLTPNWDAAHTAGLVSANQSQLSNSFVWFAGIGGELTMFDPFRFAMDFYYSGNDTKHSYGDRSGFYVGGSAEYKTAYGVPTLKVWYASGDDEKVSNGSERPLTLSGFFNPGASTYYKGRYGIGTNVNRGDAAGTWGVSAQWNKLSFIEDLSHDFAVTYFQGTNAERMIRRGYIAGANPANYMTTADSAIDLEFRTTYNIYKNLATCLEIGYIIEDFDGKVWGGSITPAAGHDKTQFSNAWRATLNFRYTF